MEIERKIQLHQEMEKAIDPTVGNKEAAALAVEVGKLKAESSQLRKSQRQLQTDVLKAVAKREVIELKVCAFRADNHASRAHCQAMLQLH